MKAIVLNDFGDVDVLKLLDIPTPVPAAGEVLVEIKALSLNPVDVKTRAGKGISGRLRDHLPVVLGWDIAGVVKLVGTDVTDFKIGDEVFGMVNFPGHGRAYAQYVAAPSTHLAIKPGNISFAEAAATTLAALTAWQIFEYHANIQKGQRVFIHAAAGGVGHFAVQFAKQRGAYVIGSSSKENMDFVHGVGADEHFDYKNRRFEDEIRDIDFVLDAIGGDNIDRSLPMIKRGGAIVSIPSGLREDVKEKAKANGINGFFILVKSDGNDMRSLAKLLADGSLKAHVSKTFPFEKMKEAHLDVERGRTVGKVVVFL